MPIRVTFNTTENTEAFKIAEQRIQEAKDHQSQRLSLSDLTHLKRLPPSISELSTLQVLGLENTQVDSIQEIRGLDGLLGLFVGGSPIVDLAPIAELKKLQRLSIENTKVSDLRPVTALKEVLESAILVKGQVRGGVSFRNIPATNDDATLERISLIADIGHRTAQLFEYLDSIPPWPQPLEALIPYEPQQKSSLDFIWTADGFALNSAPVDVKEDPVAQAILDDLIEMLNELCRQSGNHYEDIYRRAEDLRERLANTEIDRLRIHLAFQRLQRLYDKRAARIDPLDGEVEATLQDVVETLPGLTLSDPNVRDLLERQALNRSDRVSATQVEAEIGVLNAVVADDTPFDNEAQVLAGDASTVDTDDQLTRARPILSWNAVVVVGQEFRNAPVATASAALACTPAVLQSAPWLVAHADDILIAARLWGPEFLAWINPIIGQARAIVEAKNSRPY